MTPHPHTQPTLRPRLPGLWRGLLACVCWVGSGHMAQAQDVSLAGVTADKALLVVNGAPPRFVTTGQSLHGVKLLSVQNDQAVVEVQGHRRTLTMGQGPLPGTPVEAAAAISLVADAQGHFLLDGQINGKPMRFLLDTGATALTLSEADAKRLGLPYLQGQKVRVRTANGETNGYHLSLTSVKLSGYTAYNVAAVVLPVDMPFALLGNSFLARFNMRRENDRMTLEPRY